MQFKKLIIIGVFLAGFFLLEPVYREKLSFAVTYFDQPTFSYENINNTYLPEYGAASVPVKPQRAHAPEPTTLLLFLSGIGGMIVRFARKNFEIFKRMMDLSLSVIGLLIASPVLAFAAALILLESPGPVIYRQNRVGKKHKVFKIYKLRTMRIDAEKFTGAVWARENDPRITRVGRFLRKTHVDEIPQLFNVIRGEMSIVGPRPERPEMVRTLKTLIHDYEKRLAVNPGITGLAQAVHKYDSTIVDVKKKVKYDLLYIKKMCLWTDLQILARTCVVVVTGKGAH
ncbi:MAG TPA: sugar transferase [Candidatus Omnitrophota bacterium]|nr:sugar transferase [Candidatus Omnitrophota bacterium]